MEEEELRNDGEEEAQQATQWKHITGYKKN